MTPGQHDPGGKVVLRLGKGIEGDAVFSACDRFRPLLTRAWNASKPLVVFACMNPSMGRARVDDPTLARAQAIAWRAGAGRFAMVNVVDFRATHPKMLLKLPHGTLRSDACLPTIHAQAAAAAESGGFVVVAWGALPRHLRPYAEEALDALRQSGVRIMCLGLTEDGSPRHPSRVSPKTPLIPFPMTSAKEGASHE